MPVNLSAPDPGALLPIGGVELGAAAAGIRKAGGDDLVLIRIAPGAQVAGVFTRNAFAAAPVQLCRQRLAAGRDVRGLLINAGNANCGTGAQGLADARRTCEAAARALGCDAEEVLPFSTGVILEPLPVQRIESAVASCAERIGPGRWFDAARAIMTTDTVAKGCSRRFELDGRRVSVTGIAKGVGMIAPDMATMLTYIATDAKVGRDVLRQLVREVADKSFNCVTVDGDTSTNDSFILIATGMSGAPEIGSRSDPRCAQLLQALEGVAVTLAQAIARDGEGATKFMTIDVSGARSDVEAAAVAKRVANSPLVKTAFFASDPNLGRLIMAIGNAGIEGLDPARVSIALGGVAVLERGARAASYREEDGARVMKAAEIPVTIDLGRGTGHATVWTCDFSYDYVKINAEYRT